MSSTGPLVHDDYVAALRLNFLTADEQLLARVINAHRDALTQALILRVYGQLLKERKPPKSGTPPVK